MAANDQVDVGSTVPSGNGDFLFSHRWMQLSWGFGLGLFLLVGLSLAENGAHVRREKIREVTGLGDTVFFHPPAVRVGEEVASVSGRGLILAESREHPLADLEMRRVATDGKTGLSVYERRAAKDRVGIYYLRLSPGVYLKVHLSR